MGRQDFETETLIPVIGGFFDNKEPYTLAIRGRENESSLEYRQDGTANAILTPNGGRGGIGVGAIAFPEQLSGTQCATTEDLAPAMGATNPTAVAIGIDSQLNAATEAIGPLTTGSPSGGGQPARADTPPNSKRYQLCRKLFVYGVLSCAAEFKEISNLASSPERLLRLDALATACQNELNRLMQEENK